MKKSLIIVLISLISTAVFAQMCDLYFPLVESNGVQFQSFDRRDRLQGTQDLMVKEVINHADRIEAVINTKYYDNRENFQHESDFTVICKGNEIILDIQSVIDQSMLQGFQDMEVEMSGIDIVFPDNPSVGQELEDASMTISVSSGGMKLTEMTFTIRDRKIEGMETITTPAGTFEAFKITSEMHTESRTMGISHRITMTSIDYWAEGVGTVRSESYNSRGRLESYTLLSKIY
ncbi:MAG: hypothetical protein EA393_02620 [Bacteroidetes bacterium]|nr:MAG: hypothetical protein EA393_02620 [Bacteroidota bacterium]